MEKQLKNKSYDLRKLRHCDAVLDLEFGKHTHWLEPAKVVSNKNPKLYYGLNTHKYYKFIGYKWFEINGNKKRLPKAKGPKIIKFEEIEEKANFVYIKLIYNNDDCDLMKMKIIKGENKCKNSENG